VLDDHAVDSDSPRLSKTVMGMALGAGRDEMAAERHGGQAASRSGERWRSHRSWLPTGALAPGPGALAPVPGALAPGPGSRFGSGSGAPGREPES